MKRSPSIALKALAVLAVYGGSAQAQNPPIHRHPGGVTVCTGKGITTYNQANGVRTCVGRNGARVRSVHQSGGVTADSVGTVGQNYGVTVGDVSSEGQTGGVTAGVVIIDGSNPPPRRVTPAPH